MTLSVLITTLIITSVTSVYIEREDKNPLSYDGFLSNNNSNITYLISNDGSQIEACEYVNVTYDWYENGTRVEGNSTSEYEVRLKYYWKAEARDVVSSIPFEDYFDCVNFMIYDVYKRKGLIIPLKRYLRTNRVTVDTITDLKIRKGVETEIFCSDWLDWSILHAEPRNYTESYSTERFISDGFLVSYGPDVLVPYLQPDFLTRYTDNSTVDYQGNSFNASWTHTRLAENISVPAHSGRMLSQTVYEVKKLKEYTMDFEIDDDLPDEDSKRFKTFRQKVVSGEVTFSQRSYGIFFDFINENSTVLRNLPAREYVTQVTKMYVLSDPADCNQLFEIRRLLRHKQEQD